jgi:DNA-binding HxlR family transcriptional regulator
MRKLKSQNVGECPCEYALRYIGGAWKILIVVILDRTKIRRYAELKRVLRGITPKILTQQLREMERDGLIETHGVPGSPAKSGISADRIRRNVASCHRCYVDMGKTDARGTPAEKFGRDAHRTLLIG